MDPSLVAELVARAFEASGVPYALVGSMASTVHGEPRGTMDVDFATLMRLEHVELFHRHVSPAFAIDAAWIRDAVRELRMFQLVHIGSYIKVDVYVRREQGADAAQVLRAERVNLGGSPDRTVKVASAEDTVLQKLRWYEAGGSTSDRQWRDVLGVLKTKGKLLDRGYLSTTAATLGLTALLQRALDQTRL